MQVKEVKPTNFLYFRTETKVNELINFLPVGQELYKEAVLHKIPITGPIQWHYFGFTGDETQSFILEISLPVAELPAEYDGKYHVKRTESFKCVSIIHEGDWLEIPKSYGKIMGFVAEKKLTPMALNREVYINTDFKNPEANITEIQMGVK